MVFVSKRTLLCLLAALAVFAGTTTARSILVEGDAGVADGGDYVVEVDSEATTDGGSEYEVETESEIDFGDSPEDRKKRRKFIESPCACMLCAGCAGCIAHALLSPNVSLQR